MRVCVSGVRPTNYEQKPAMSAEPKNGISENGILKPSTARTGVERGEEREKERERERERERGRERERERDLCTEI